MFVSEILFLIRNYWLLLKQSSGISELVTWSCYVMMDHFSLSAFHPETFIGYLLCCRLSARL